MSCSLKNQVNLSSRDGSWLTWQGRTTLSPTVMSSVVGCVVMMVASETHSQPRFIEPPFPFCFFFLLFLHGGDRDSWATPSFLWMCQTQFIEGYAGRSTQQNSDCPATISGISFSPGSSLSGLQEVSFLNLGSGHVSLSASAWLELSSTSCEFPERTAKEKQ